MLVATKNAGKAREFGELLGGAWRVETLKDRPELVEGVEDGATFEANAAKKALAIGKQLGGGVLVLADDSGLEVDALGGAPGVYSARYAGESDPALRDGRNNAKLLAALDGLPLEKRGAQFRCSLCLVRGEEVVATADGICRGALLDAPRGADGFGYDPLFLPVIEGGALSAKTFAEMNSDAKHALSHRGKAMAIMAGKMRAMASV
ncbi:MAG TPA: non-canonical purine NTP pyrophosphatase [Candidatus Methylacidiphilales bacterium]